MNVWKERLDRLKESFEILLLLLIHVTVDNNLPLHHYKKKLIVTAYIITIDGVGSRAEVMLK